MLDTEVKSSNILHYQGNGLSFGECGAEISAAINSDDGLWSCFMGIADSGEQVATVSVTVTGWKMLILSEKIFSHFIHPFM